MWAQHQQDSIRVADSLKRIENENNVIETIKQNAKSDTDKEKLPGSVGESRITYFIIAGSFTNSENARMEAGKYNNLGYKASIINATNRNGINVKLVSVSTSKNFNEAIRYLREFQSKFNPKAWLYSGQ